MVNLGSFSSTSEARCRLIAKVVNLPGTLRVQKVAAQVVNSHGSHMRAADS